jgi:hypothetical protein
MQEDALKVKAARDPVQAENAAAYSGPAYLPAVCGNSDFTIFIFEMSTVASMCRNIAASRRLLHSKSTSCRCRRAAPPRAGQPS